MPPLLEMRAIAKAFPGVRALRGVDLTLHAGEVLALLGENGAGKSTLIKILCGAHRPDSGSIRLAGAETAIRSPHDARRAGVAVIHQEFNLVPALSAAENIFLGRECTRAGFIAHGEQRRHAAELFARIGVAMDPGALLRDLTVAQQQVVEIARTLADDARILVLDEPTAALSHHEVERLFTIIRDLRAHGIGVIYISHRLDEIFALCDRIAVLRDGANAGERPVGGGTSLSGGEGKMFGTLIGAFIIAVIQNGMNLTGVESYTQKVVLGLVIIAAVLLDRLKRHGWRGE